MSGPPAATTRTPAGGTRRRAPTTPPGAARDTAARSAALLAAAREATAREAATRLAAPGRVGARTNSSRPAATGTPLTSAQARALRTALAARAAGTPPAGKARAAGTRRRPAARGARPASRTPAREPARERARTPAARGHEAGTRRWRLRLSLAALGLLLPLLAGVLAPGTQPTGSAAEPATTPDLALTAHGTMTDGAARYRALEQDLAARRAELSTAQATERAARERLAVEQVAVGTRAADLYRSSPEGRHPLLALSLDDPATAPDVLHREALAERSARERERAVVRAGRAGTDLAIAVRRVAAAQAAVGTAERQAAAVLDRLRAEAGALPADAAARLATVGAVPGPAPDAAQQALRRWQDQLGALAAAGITSPPAAALADPAALPPGLSPALDAAGRPVPGVAWAVAGNRPVTVLPAETVAAVSNALAQVGKPYVPGGGGPAAYDCGGLAAASWLLAGHAIPPGPAEQWATGTAVPLSQLQIGDLVFTDGGADVGIHVGEGQVVSASAVTYQVGVRTIADVTGAVRVTLPAATAPNAPLPAGTAGRGACGAVPPPPGPVSPAWGGWANGTIPATALCPVARGHALRCDAAVGYAALAEAFSAEFGRPLCITDSYRSLTAQVTAFRTKPALAAVPGTSNHGWALAVDLCGGINGTATPESAWMAVNAGRFGWVQPDWARPGGEKPEPWHWEFGSLA